MKLIFTDAETRYDSKSYTLKRMTTQEYIHDPRFKCFGWGLAVEKGAPVWVTGDKIKPVLEKVIPGNAIVGHNIGGFDAAILNWIYDLKPALIIDTLSMSRAVIGERIRSHSLESVSQYILGRGKLPYLKEMDGVVDPSPQQLAVLGQYCALHPTQSDIALTRDIFYKLAPHFPKHEFAVADLIARMYTEPALYLDNELLIQYHGKVVATRLRALDEAGIENPTEVRSNPQFAAALIRLGVDPPLKISPTTGKETWAFAKTDEGMLALMEHDDERVQALVAARLENRSTIAETRCESFMTASRYGEFPINYLFSGAQTTHRLSGGGGNNLQNLPRGGDLRKAIEAPPGYMLVVGDLAQIELRITLALAVELLKYQGLDWQNSTEYKALQILASGGDLYGEFGSTVYQKPISKATHPLERQISKSAVLGLGFGMGAEKFIAYCKGQGIPVDPEFAQHVVKLYRGTYTGVVRLWRYMNDAVKLFCFEGKEARLFEEPDVWIKFTALFGDPCIGLSNGLQVKYPGLAYDPNDRSFAYDRATGKAKLFAGKYVENLVQYLARQIIMEQTVKVNKRYRVAMSTHDELVCLVPEDAVAEGAKWVEETMTKPVVWWPSLPLGAEVKSAKRYGDAK